jgi:predicted heme/steroid binding protein
LKKCIIVVVGIVITVLIVGVSINRYISEHNKYSRILKMNWKIELPDKYKEIYSLDSGPSFHGDGERYHIFGYENNINISSSLEWRDGKDSALEENVKDILGKLEVSEENIPDLQKSYKYYYKLADDSSRIYIIFSSNLNRVYVVEEFL